MKLLKTYRKGLEMSNIQILENRAYKAFKPPRKLTLSEWADENAYLSVESSAEGGRWRTLPYQKGMMDAITDPGIEQVTVMKSARVGYSKDFEPCDCLSRPPGSSSNHVGATND